MLSLVVLSCMVGASLQAGLFFGGNPQPKSNMIDPMAWQKPWFCHDNDCPVYTVVENTTKYERRRYQESEWVATNMSSMLFGQTERSMLFWKLFRYIDGNNSMQMKIAMTSPVVTEIRHGQGPDCESNFTMHFMIPHSLQPVPPTPTEKGVYIKKIPAFEVYVKQYSGFSDDDSKRKNIVQIADDLQLENKSFDDRVYFTAGYDGPYRFTDRHNEVWVLPK